MAPLKATGRCAHNVNTQWPHQFEYIPKRQIRFLLIIIEHKHLPFTAYEEKVFFCAFQMEEKTKTRAVEPRASCVKHGELSNTIIYILRYRNPQQTPKLVHSGTHKTERNKESNNNNSSRWKQYLCQLIDFAGTVSVWDASPRSRSAIVSRAHSISAQRFNAAAHILAITISLSLCYVVSSTRNTRSAVDRRGFSFAEHGRVPYKLVTA